MSADPVRRANLAAIASDSRPQLPDGFLRQHPSWDAARRGPHRP